MVVGYFKIDVWVVDIKLILRFLLGSDFAVPYIVVIDILKYIVYFGFYKNLLVLIRFINK